MTASTRRAALGTILAAPLTGGAVMALPSGSPQPVPLSDLAAACEWARGHWLGMDARCRAENWDDDKLDAESDLYHGVFERALAEPSQNLTDLKAKAQLCLTDFEAHLFPFRKPEDNSEPDGGALMILTVLREVIALCT